ncbi:MAG: helix-turn-helix domain-containing protein [Chitinispirillaceae bacterium]
MKRNVLILLPAAVISAALFSLLLHFTLAPYKKINLTVFPDRTVSTSPIEDSFEGGNSKVVRFHQDSSLSFSYTLQSGFKYPYAGANLNLGQCDTCGIDFSPFDTIALTLTSSTEDAIRIFLKEYNESIYTINDPTSFIYREIEYIPSTDSVTQTFALEDFTYPTWWKLNKSIPEETSPSVGKVCFIELFSGLSRSDKDTVDIKLSGIELRGENHEIGLFLTLGYILIWSLPLAIVLITLYSRIIKRVQQRRNRLKMLQKSKKLKLTSQDSQPGSRILEYIATHFTNPELTLPAVARGAGVAKSRVTEEIRKELNTTFKGYLNDLRLHEAARLLEESSRQITEIALAVGFNNVSHFNRLFREKFRKSPREYRASQVQKK